MATWSDGKGLTLAPLGDEYLLQVHDPLLSGNLQPILELKWFQATSAEAGSWRLPATLFPAINPFLEQIAKTPSLYVTDLALNGLHISPPIGEYKRAIGYVLDHEKDVLLQTLVTAFKVDIHVIYLAYFRNRSTLEPGNFIDVLAAEGSEEPLRRYFYYRDQLEEVKFEGTAMTVLPAEFKCPSPYGIMYFDRVFRRNRVHPDFDLPGLEMEFTKELPDIETQLTKRSVGFRCTYKDFVFYIHITSLQAGSELALDYETALATIEDPATLYYGYDDQHILCQAKMTPAQLQNEESIRDAIEAYEATPPDSDEAGLEAALDAEELADWYGIEV